MDEPWLVAAKKLPTGGRGRFPHECGSGEAMLINNGVNGYSGYCNRCHATPFVPHGQRTFKELMELKQLEQARDSELTTVELPYDFTLDIPSIGMLWLFKAGITPFKAAQLGIGWSEYFQRVFIPIYFNKKLVYFQARAVHSYQDIKYLNPKVDRSNIGYWVIPEGANHSRVVITEDILSAIRVGHHVPAMSALGTKLSIGLANQLADQYDHVTTWLDSDTAGVEGARDMRKLLGLTVPTSNILTTLDPKNLSDEEIYEALNKVKAPLSPNAVVYRHD